MEFHTELTILRCSSDTIATCPVFSKRTGDHLLGKVLLLDLAHLETPKQSTVANFGLIRVNRFINFVNVIAVP